MDESGSELSWKQMRPLAVVSVIDRYEGGIGSGG